MLDIPTNQKDKKGRTTERHKKLLSLMVANGRNGRYFTKKEMLEEVGYSDAIATHPSRVLDSAGFLTYCEEQLPTDYLLMKNRELLESKELKQMQFDESITDDEIQEIIEGAGYQLLNIRKNETEYTTKKRGAVSFRKKNVFYMAPNALEQDRALDKAYKVKQFYRQDGKGQQPNDFSKLTPAEIREKFAQLVLRIGTYIPRGSR